jgi:FkbM family methyltransferase
VLVPYSRDGISLLVRAEVAAAEQMIVREVQDSYAWDFTISRAVDVGAHIGAWTLGALHLFESARVAAIEVDSANLEVLHANLDAVPRAVVVGAHCGYTPGDYEVARHRYNSGSTRVIAQASRDDYDPTAWSLHPVPTRLTVEDVMRQCGFASIDTLKLDCEGGEVDIVNHLAPATLAGLHHLVGEVHMPPDEFERLTDDRLSRAGFRLTYEPHPANPVLHTFHAHR